MQVFYDESKDVLVGVKQTASSEYWDQHWLTQDLKKYIESQKNYFVLKLTKKYLKSGSKILEGGCGRGDKVYSLQKKGYDVFGIDFAQQTVRIINKVCPDLKIKLGDVFNLSFDEESFDGYWSLGVIEHFYEGYDAILHEMKRVLKVGGYVFLTVPAISFLRRRKILSHKYPLYEENKEYHNNFYQYFLEPKNVINDFEKNGFIKKEVFFFDGFKGLKDESIVLNSLMQSIYNSELFVSKVVKKVLNFILSPFAGHSCCIVFQKSINEK